MTATMRTIIGAAVVMVVFAIYVNFMIAVKLNAISHNVDALPSAIHQSLQVRQ